jgi:plasmid stabilization system protein ParE
MIFRVIITRRAERDMQAAARWWAIERSAEQAKRWLAGLETKLQSLTESPERCALSPENGRFSFELRELHYGLSNRATHRAVFTIADELVLVLAVRHAAQDFLQPDDLI